MLELLALAGQIAGTSLLQANCDFVCRPVTGRPKPDARLAMGHSDLENWLAENGFDQNVVTRGLQFTIEERTRDHTNLVPWPDADFSFPIAIR